MSTSANEGVPKFSADTEGSVREVRDGITESENAVHYLRGLYNERKYFGCREAFSGVRNIIKAGLEEQFNPHASEFAELLQHGGVLGIDLASTQLGEGSDAKIAECIEWSYQRIVREDANDTQDASVINHGGIIGRLLEYGEVDPNQFSSAYLQLPEEIYEAIQQSSAESYTCTDHEANKRFIEIGMGYVLKSVAEYADAWDYLNTMNGFGRQDADHNRLLYEI